MEETRSILRLTKWQMPGAKETTKERYREYILRCKIATVDQKKSTKLVVGFDFGFF